ncbi:MAG: hypothetical protein Q4G07_09765 [Oscillospiraceae bacterium]|nr:hypothetical protein [Oscillospiraceae bacterium]
MEKTRANREALSTSYGIKTAGKDVQGLFENKETIFLQISYLQGKNAATLEGAVCL